MKKKISLFVTTMMILGMVFTGCGTSGNIVSGIVNTVSNLPEALDGDHDKTCSLEELKVAKYSTLFLVKNNTKYHMKPMGSNENPIALERNGGNGNAFLCFNTQDYGDIEQPNLISVENAPVPIIRQDDKLYSHTGYDGEINIRPLKFTGYTPLILKEGLNIIIGKASRTVLNPEDRLPKELIISTVNESGKIEKRNLSPQEAASLEYGQEVKIEWKNWNDKWNNLITTAECAHYEYSGDSIKLESIGKETIDGTKFCIYDFGELEKGYYALCRRREPQSIFVIQ